MIKYFRALLTAGIILILTYPILFVRTITKKKNDINRIKGSYRFTRFICKCCNFGLGVKYKVENVQVLDELEGNIVLISNHQSDYDILSLISIIKREFSPLAKKEVRKYLFVGKLSYIIDTEYIDRENLRSQVKIIKNCINKVDNKRMMLIFPEGTRTKNINREMLDFKPGAFKIATDPKATIVPIVLDGTYTILKRKYPIRKTKATIKFLKPITYQEYSNMSNIELSEYIHSLIKTELANIKSETK